RTGHNRAQKGKAEINRVDQSQPGFSNFLLYYITGNYQNYWLHDEYDAGYYGRYHVVENYERHRRSAEQQPVEAAGHISSAIFNLHIALVFDLDFKVGVFLHLLIVPEFCKAKPENCAEGHGKSDICHVRQIGKS